MGFNVDRLTRDLRSVAHVRSVAEVVAQMERDREEALRLATQPLNVLVPSVDERLAAANPTAQIAHSLAEVGRTPLIQFMDTLASARMDQYDARAALVGTNLVHRAAEYLAKPFEVGMLASLADSVWASTDWRPVLTRWALPPEAAFLTRLPELQRTMYLSMRPEILSVADVVRRNFEVSSVTAFVRWAGRTQALDLNSVLDLDLNPLLDLDLGPVPDDFDGGEGDFDVDLEHGVRANGSPPLLAPPAPTPKRQHKHPEVQTPLDLIDTTAAIPRQRRPLITKQRVVQIANHPLTVTIVGGVVGSAIGGPWWSSSSTPSIPSFRVCRCEALRSFRSLHGANPRKESPCLVNSISHVQFRVRRNHLAVRPENNQGHLQRKG